MSRPHDVVALRVVNYLGATALVTVIGVVWLVYSATQYDQVAPETVPLVAGVSTLAGIALGSLGSILASTGKGAPQPVLVENPPSDPVPTKPTPPAAAPEPSPFSVGAVNDPL